MMNTGNTTTGPNESAGFTLRSQTIGGLPIVNNVFERLRLPALLAGVLPASDVRLKLAPAAAIRLVVTNLILGREPLYELGEWAARFDPALLGLSIDEVRVVNDDRVGRALEALFDADRASLLTAVVLQAVSEFGVDTSQLHNDSTSISVHGFYAHADGAPRDGKPTPVITFGLSKDHRPDLKQLVWILTVAGDGAVPITYRLADGNTTDDRTHVPTWDGLAALLGRTDFLYVADSKLCSRPAMSHINDKGGRFVTLLTRSRNEDGDFRDWVQTHTPEWIPAITRPGKHLGDPDEIYSVAPAPALSTEGYRIVWVHSTNKATHDAFTRQARIDDGLTKIEALAVKLAGPRCRIKTRAALEQALSSALTHAARWVTATITETILTTTVQQTRGQPGPKTRYRHIQTSHFTLQPNIDLDHVSYDAASDGCFPLITNDHDLTDTAVLTAYRYQPNLERRHHLLKSVQNAAPVLLHNPARIEALFCCQFLALLIQALIEREVRTAMVRAATTHIGLYPELRACTAPSTERILEIFAPISRHHLYQHDALIQTFPAELTDLHQQILDLLGLSTDTYNETKS